MHNVVPLRCCGCGEVGHFRPQCPSGENVADFAAEVVKVLKKLFLEKPSEGPSEGANQESIYSS